MREGVQLPVGWNEPSMMPLVDDVLDILRINVWDVIPPIPLGTGDNPFGFPQ